MRIRGGPDAPSRARRLVLSQLDGQIGPTTASDVALVVSELVTNSVVHADVGRRRTLTVELASRAQGAAKGGNAELPKIEGRPTTP